MTTQVVLMNGLGVALASDSAVTAGGKVLNTSEKIFALPAPHKAALLTSGRAAFMGIPWEVVFSAWSESLDRPLASMVDYRESLYKFLRSTVPNNGELTRSERDYLMSSYWGKDNVYSLVKKIYSELVQPHFESILEPEDWESFCEGEWSDEFRDRMSSLVSHELSEAFATEMEKLGNERREKQEAPEGISEAQAFIWIQNYWTQIERDPQQDFSAWPAIPNLAKLVMHLHSAFIVHPDFSDSNVNVVGFGVGDLFPSAAGTFVNGCVRGTLIKRWEGYSDSTNGTRNFFFGQDDAISALFRGEDWLLSNTASEANREALSQIYDKLGESQDETIQMAREYVKQSMESDSVKERIMNAGREERQEPFRKAIGMSPILDLAEFSAQLVGVQAAYAAMTQENPSVGGVVDVAIITHKNGFEWIRHKH